MRTSNRRQRRTFPTSAALAVAGESVSRANTIAGPSSRGRESLEPIPRPAALFGDECILGLIEDCIVPALVNEFLEEISSQLQMPDA